MNGRNRIWTVLAVLLVLAGASAQAHHSFNDIFDVGTVTTLKGTISKIDWINPHVYINLDVKDSSGKITTWGVESPPTNHLRSAGISRQDLLNNAPAGEVVTVYVNPAKATAKADRPLGLLMRITYADGHFFHVRGDPMELAAAK
jgi:hypothetical protein